MASSYDWDSLKDNNIDTYANNITSAILSIASQCIPNKKCKDKTIRPTMVNFTYKTVHSQTEKSLRQHWLKFKRIRNEVNTMIHDSKQNMYTKISEKLKSDSISSKDWWKTLKTFISPLTRSELPPLELNGTIYTDDTDKANILNNYFQQQTILQKQNTTLPALPPPIYHAQLSSIVLTPLEIESAIKTLKVGKVSGPNGLSNRIMRELNPIIPDPFCSLFNQSLRQGIVPAPYKDANV